ncbi:MAG: hypothetical protein ACQGVK_12045 [Myxococcota bacterium]
MNTSLRASLVFHGVLVIVIGLLAGFPYAFVISGDLAGEVRAWRMAHLEGVLNGLVMIGIAASGGLMTLSAGQARWIHLGLLAAGYGNVAASIIGASFGVRGLQPTGPAANWVVFLLFTIAIVGVLGSLGLAALGAWRSRRP